MPTVDLVNWGLCDYMATNLKGDHVVSRPFCKASIEISDAADEPVVLHFKDGFMTPVRFGVVAGVAGRVVAPQWVNRVSNGLLSLQKILDGTTPCSASCVRSTSKAFEVKVFTMWLGVPWFCVVASAIAILILSTVVVISTMAHKRNRSRVYTGTTGR